VFKVINASAKQILVGWIFQRNFTELAERYIRGRLIDIGCGNKPYRDMLAGLTTEHVGVDHDETLHGKSNIDIFGTAYEIPVPDSTFDSAICTAVLEHLEEPELAIRECHRVLKQEGIAIYSVPFIWHIHEEPRDFYRFSKYGLKYLFEKAGFEIIEVRPLSGFWVTFGQLLVYNLYRFNGRIMRRLKIIDGIGLVIQAVSYVLNKIDNDERWTWMYMVVARKK
jgi:SAM-dependent methyltransferase